MRIVEAPVLMSVLRLRRLLRLALAMLLRLLVLLMLRLLLVLLTARIGFRLRFALRFDQHAGVMLCVLKKILGRYAVVRQLRIAREQQILVDDLLRCAADLAIRARRIEYPVDDIAQGPLTVRL